MEEGKRRTLGEWVRQNGLSLLKPDHPLFWQGLVVALSKNKIKNKQSNPDDAEVEPPQGSAAPPIGDDREPSDGQ
ncbi:MAG TPA: hypothetical protein VFV10_01685 [Gammaproteobacteria bacterium]|nr:hypothetical protein [Gammaproteobacteria bacterium]